MLPFLCAPALGGTSGGGIDFGAPPLRDDGGAISRISESVCSRPRWYSSRSTRFAPSTAAATCALTHPDCRADHPRTFLSPVRLRCKTSTAPAPIAIPSVMASIDESPGTSYYLLLAHPQTVAKFQSRREACSAELLLSKKDYVMALGTSLAFAAGVVVGWTGRAALGSTREALVHSIVLGHRAREVARRLVAEQVEWVEDMFAEGRARYESAREVVPVEHDEPPRVVEVPKKRRGHAA